MPFDVMTVLSTASLIIRNGEGEDLSLASMTYNASISALEVRAYRAEGEPPGLVSKIGKGPLRIFECGLREEPMAIGQQEQGAQTRGRRHAADPAPLATIHFETATLGFAFECDPCGRASDGGPMRDTAVREVVILRGLRIEQ